jgi:hypothetical protein
MAMDMDMDTPAFYRPGISVLTFSTYLLGLFGHPIVIGKAPEGS